MGAEYVEIAPNELPAGVFGVAVAGERERLARRAADDYFGKGYLRIIDVIYVLADYVVAYIVAVACRRVFVYLIGPYYVVSGVEKTCIKASASRKETYYFRCLFIHD